MKKYLGCDLSHWNTVSDWDALNKSVDFIILKVTEGTTYLDPTFNSRKDKIKVLRGLYHFSRYGNYQAEADWFLKNVDLKEGDFVCLDAERGESEEWRLKWMDYVSKKTGLKCINYGDVKNWKSTKYPLWVARYGPNDGQMHENYPPNIGPYKDYLVWQYTSRGSLPGVSGYVDMNRADKDLDNYCRKKDVPMDATVPPSVNATDGDSATLNPKEGQDNSTAQNSPVSGINIPGATYPPSQSENASEVNSEAPISKESLKKEADRIKTVIISILEWLINILK